jgi:hypothetical protein
MRISEILFWNTEPTEENRSDLQRDLPPAPFSDDLTDRPQPGPFLGSWQEHLRGVIECRAHHRVPTPRYPPSWSVSPD